MMTLPLLVLLCAAVCAMAAEDSAEPQRRFRLVNSFESGLRRPDSIYFRKRGSGFSGFGRLAEKRRVRELFGKRSAPAYDASEDYMSDSPDDQYQSIYDLMQMHRERRGRARELFG
ncbi:unnamed protein product [Cylicocyclus nassatus]|uniref:Uncharacterized protein n=1 Tax=Cylicocyclus nassatus TaxID=53992 RepID=A0AA36M7S7_CYLNA|nr:unnamed protein product [Cylicocyclus nassatus]